MEKDYLKIYEMLLAVNNAPTLSIDNINQANKIASRKEMFLYLIENDLIELFLVNENNKLFVKSELPLGNKKDVEEEKEIKDMWHNYYDVVKGLNAEEEAAVIIFIGHMLRKLKHPEEIDKSTIEVYIETTSMGVVDYTVSSRTTHNNVYCVTISAEEIKNKLFELNK